MSHTENVALMKSRVKLCLSQFNQGKLLTEGMNEKYEANVEVMATFWADISKYLSFFYNYKLISLIRLILESSSVRLLFAGSCSFPSFYFSAYLNRS